MFSPVWISISFSPEFHLFMFSTHILGLTHGSWNWGTLCCKWAQHISWNWSLVSGFSPSNLVWTNFDSLTASYSIIRIIQNRLPSVSQALASKNWYLDIPGSRNTTPKLIGEQEKSKCPGVLCTVVPGAGMNFVKKGLPGRWKLEGLWKACWMAGKQ